MATTKLVSVDQAMAFADNSMPQDLIDAWSYTTTFAQAHARTVDGDPSSRGYFDAMTTEFARLGWNVTTAGKVDYKQTANKIQPADIVKTILHPYLDDKGKSQLDGILDAIQQPNVKATNFLDFWWKKASTHADKTNMAMGPLSEVNNASNITMIYYGFNFDASSWRSLFIEQESASLVANAFNLEMNLNMALYGQIKSDLIAKLAGKEKDHINDTTLDL